MSRRTRNSAVWMRQAAGSGVVMRIEIFALMGLFCFLLALVIWMFCVALAWLAVRQ